jgi:hypothetical protein
MHCQPIAANSIGYKIDGSAESMRIADLDAGQQARDCFAWPEKPARPPTSQEPLKVASAQAQGAKNSPAKCFYFTLEG